MTMNDDRPDSQSTQARRRRWKPWILVPAILGAAIGGALAARVTPIYKAEMLIAVVPQRIPESFVPPTISLKLGERLQMISEQILNRTRLERIIQEFDLYKEERQRQIMEDILEAMRANIETNVEASEGGDAVAFRVGFIGTNPRTVMMVTERLATLFIKENMQDRSTLADATSVFLESQLKDVGRRLVQHNKQLGAAREKREPEAETLAIENEVLRATYKDVSAKIEEARIAANLERQHIGEQFKVLDGARLPERPIAPDWPRYIGVGAGGGAAFGLLLLLVAPTRSSSNRRQARHAEAPESNESLSDTPASAS